MSPLKKCFLCQKESTGGPECKECGRITACSEEHLKLHYGIRQGRDY